MLKKFFSWDLEGLRKIAGSGSGSISQRHGSSDPDPHQNVMDLEHWEGDLLAVLPQQINRSTVIPHTLPPPPTPSLRLYGIVYPESRCRLSFFKPIKGERKITVDKYYKKTYMFLLRPLWKFLSLRDCIRIRSNISDPIGSRTTVLQTWVFPCPRKLWGGGGGVLWAARLFLAKIW